MSEHGPPLPQTLTQAGGRVAESLVGGFTGAPALLLLLVIQIFGMAMAGYFLLRQEDYRHLERIEIVAILKACMAPVERFDRYQEPPAN